MSNCRVERNTQAFAAAYKQGRNLATKRTLIEPHKGDKRYIRRAADGEFTEKQVDDREISGG
jgi:hypothetical protein